MLLSRHFALCLALLFVAGYAFGQDSAARVSLINKADSNEAIKTTDSVRSKNMTSQLTDLLPQVLQSAVNAGLISSNGSTVKLNTTIFGLQKLFNPKVAVDTNYIHESLQRNFSFGGAIDISSSNTINGGQGNIKWAIVNNRDPSNISYAYLGKGLSKIRRKMDTLCETLVFELDKKITAPLLAAHRAVDAAGKPAPTIPDSVFRRLEKALTTFTNSQKEADFDAIETAFKPYSKQVLIDTSIFQEYHQQKTLLIDSLADSLAAGISKRGILTLSANSNWQMKSTDSLILKLEYEKGLGGPQDTTKPWDLYLGMFYNFKTDSVSKQILQRDIASLKFGVNKVFARRSDGGPFFEVLGTAEVDDVVYGRYTGENQYTILGDFTFTINPTKSISIPLEIKYDPKNKNFLGFLNVKWDIKTSGSK